MNAPPTNRSGQPVIGLAGDDTLAVRQRIDALGSETEEAGDSDAEPEADSPSD